MRNEMKYERIWAEVDLDAIRQNADSLLRRVGSGTKLIAVVKMDGYGHGAVPIAHELEDRKEVYGFAVATVEEALILRGSGIRKPVLVLGYTFPDTYEKLAREEIRPAVFREDMLPALSEAAAVSGRPFPVHIKVDTGMNRIGIRPDDAGLAFVKKCMETPGLEIEGIFTHFARADEADKSHAEAQLSSFLSFCKRIEKELGIRIPMRHCANSAGIIDMDYNVRNVLWRRTVDGHYRFTLVDINRTKFRSPRPKDCARALTTNVALDEFIDEYCRIRGIDRQRFDKLLRAGNRRIERRIARRRRLKDLRLGIKRLFTRSKAD